jgi:hypothetical protein
MRFYRHQPVKFTNQAMRGKHLFWDVAFGGFFPLAGYNFRGSMAQKASGAAVFAEASAHMLLDFFTPSADVINTDFRIGLGLASRLPGKFQHIALRLKIFHESTHIGDEYALTAMADSAFRRYNVSYEAAELFIGFDQRLSQSQKFLTPDHLHIYAGGRRLNKTAFADFQDKSVQKALKSKDKNEAQLGGEIFLFSALLPTLEKGKFCDFVKRIIKPQYFVAATDWCWRDKYAVATPLKMWSYNIVVGAIYGNYFDGQRTTKLLFNYYHGVNPHGQFRMEDINYLGVSYSVDF